MRTFNLQRDDDETGISGTGVVAQGIEFDDGTVAMRWLTSTASFGLYDNIEELVIIHGHEGRTYPVFHDPDAPAPDAILAEKQSKEIKRLHTLLNNAMDNRQSWLDAWKELKDKYEPDEANNDSGN